MQSSIITQNIKRISFFLALLFLFYSCNAEIKADSDERKSDGKTLKIKNQNPKDLKIIDNLEGVWYSNREPSAMQFFGDGSYRCFLPEGHTEPDSPEEVFDSGIWKIKSGILSLESMEGKQKETQIFWISDSLIYLGDLESEYDPNYGTKIEFASEMGYRKN